MIEIVEVISLKIMFNNSGIVASVAHPILVLKVDKEKDILEVAHIESITEEKSNLPETVIDKDSFVLKEEIILLNEDLK